MQKLKTALTVGILFISLIVGLQISYLLRQTAASLSLATDSMLAINFRVQATLNSIDQTAGSLRQIPVMVYAEAVNLNKHMDAVGVSLANTSADLTFEVRRFNDSVVPLLDNSSEAALKFTDAEKIFTDQFLVCTRNPGCLKSRSDAITSELMLTMDSSRRMMAQVEKATPMFIERFDRLTEQGVGIATDVHAATSRYVHPSLKSKIYAGVIDAGKICALLC